METTIKEKAVEYLNALVGQPLLYAMKSPDTELYDFGLGERVESVNQRGMRKEVGTLNLHALCRFKVIWRNGERRVDKYYEDTPCEKFHSEANRLVGLKVKRVALSDKNDLWLDFGDYWVVFTTFENSEESWRFFILGAESPHLVASDSWMELSN